ncbi:hypothetical protein J3Q64DRAFT_1748450 [Phycomyces blakesleeanus]|uniref:Helicase ATP-binding domain-containing protein n=1 Tax=Phycomyces blakesleeanus TaxID=4837 RepID=A0ABR3AVK3_PHYBL
MKRIVTFEEEGKDATEWQFHDADDSSKQQKKKHKKKGGQDREEKFNPQTTQKLDHKTFKQRKQEMLDFRKQLPIYSGREDIIKSIQDNPAVIIMGETGSGKTTRKCKIGKLNSKI